MRSTSSSSRLGSSLAALLLVATGMVVFSACSPKETAAATSKVEPPFRALEVAAASAQAQAEGKLVFVDLWAPWCGPCKLLDTTTWKDPAVGDLLAARTIAIKVNIDEDIALAEKYKVQSIPTLLVLRPDGTEVTRVTGYVDGPDFVSAFSEALQAVR